MIETLIPQAIANVKVRDYVSLRISESRTIIGQFIVGQRANTRPNESLGVSNVM